MAGIADKFVNAMFGAEGRGSQLQQTIQGLQREREQDMEAKRQRAMQEASFQLKDLEERASDLNYRLKMTPEQNGFMLAEVNKRRKALEMDELPDLPDVITSAIQEDVSKVQDMALKGLFTGTREEQMAQATRLLYSRVPRQFHAERVKNTLNFAKITDGQAQAEAQANGVKVEATTTKAEESGKGLDEIYAEMIAPYISTKIDKNAVDISKMLATPHGIATLEATDEGQDYIDSYARIWGVKDNGDRAAYLAEVRGKAEDWALKQSREKNAKAERLVFNDVGNDVRAGGDPVQIANVRYPQAVANGYEGTSEEFLAYVMSFPKIKPLDSARMTAAEKDKAIETQLKIQQMWATDRRAAGQMAKQLYEFLVLRGVPSTDPMMADVLSKVYDGMNPAPPKATTPQVNINAVASVPKGGVAPVQPFKTAPAKWGGNVPAMTVKERQAAAVSAKREARLSDSTDGKGADKYGRDAEAIDKELPKPDQNKALSLGFTKTATLHGPQRVREFLENARYFITKKSKGGPVSTGKLNNTGKRRRDEINRTEAERHPGGAKFEKPKQKPQPKPTNKVAADLLADLGR